MIKYLLTILLVFGFAATTYAAPVGLTSEADTTTSELWPGYDAELSIGIVADMVNKRAIDIDSGEFAMDAFIGRIGVGVLKKWAIYVDFGQAQDMQYDYTIKGEKYQADFDDTAIWGIGTSALIYKWDNGLEIGANASYRRADMELDKVTIDGLLYNSNDTSMSAMSDGYFEEYQGALEVAWKTKTFTPYIGVKYSEVEVDCTFTTGGSQRDASEKNASNNVGAFVGLTITPSLEILPNSEQLTINLEGRFIDEEAFNGSIAYKF